MTQMQKRKKDWAEKQTDQLIDELEEKITREYSKALKEVKKKYDDFASQFAKEDKANKEKLDKGEITQDQYDKWRTQNLIANKRWKDLSDALANDLVNVDKKVVSMMNGYMPDAYAMNYNFSTYQVEMNTSANTSFTLYSRETIERMMKEDPNLLPKRKVDVPKDKRWNRQHINSAITQGVLQGDSIDSISDRLQLVTDMDRKAAVRNARTMITGAQNSGRMDAYERARSLGIDIQKRWLATLDSRTRDSHARLDGEIVDYDKKFSNGLMYPGDPDGDPSEVYNCRCTMVPYFPKYDFDFGERYIQSEHRTAEYITYNEWVKKKSSVFTAMSKDEYLEWQKANSTKAILIAEANKRFEEKYGMTIEEANRLTPSEQKELGLFDTETHRWLDEIIDEDYLPFYKDLEQVNFGYDHIGYVRCADGSKMINAYLRSGKNKEALRPFFENLPKRKQNELIERDEKEIKKTIEAMNRLIANGEIKENVIVDRWAGINALDFMGINVEHGSSYRIGHAFVSDNINYDSAVSLVKQLIGSEIVDNGFMSTSGSSSLNVFAGSDVKFSIKVPAGTKAYITDNTDESEIIFAPGTQQIIEDVKIIETEAYNYDGSQVKRKAIEIILKLVQK